MNIKAGNTNGVKIAIVEPAAGEKVIRDTQSALDLAMTVKYEYDTNRIAVPKEAIAEEFFILSSGVAGEILQKYINYQIKIAIFGDFTRYTSKPLHDFMYESNNGNDVFFVATEEEAAKYLTGAL